MIILVVSQSKRASTKTELHNCVQLYSNLWTLALCAFIATYWSVIVNKFLRDRSLMWVWVKKLCFINIFTRTFRTGDKICRLGSFFFQFSSRFVGSLLASDGGDRGSGRMLSPSVMLSCLVATFIGAFDCVTSVSPLVNMISMTQAVSVIMIYRGKCTIFYKCYTNSNWNIQVGVVEVWESLKTVTWLVKFKVNLKWRHFRQVSSFTTVVYLRLCVRFLC